VRLSKSCNSYSLFDSLAAFVFYVKGCVHTTSMTWSACFYCISDSVVNILGSIFFHIYMWVWEGGCVHCVLAVLRVLEELELIPTSGLIPFAARPNEARGPTKLNGAAKTRI
jgi:hypothetical protein